MESTYFLPISIDFNNLFDLLWEQRVGGSNPSAPTIELYGGLWVAVLFWGELGAGTLVV